MKKLLCGFLCTLMILSLFPTFAYAETTDFGTCGEDGDNLLWSLENNILTISGEGGMTSEEFDWSDYNSIVTDLVIESGVTTIGSGAFSCFEALTNVTFPDTLEFIDECAFEDCFNISTINIPSISAWLNIEMSTFQANPIQENTVLKINDTPVTEIIIPEGFTEIKSYSFANYTKLEKITFNDEMKVIGDSAFSACTKLKKIVFPEGLFSINKNAFLGCTELSDVTFPKSIRNIELNAFKKTAFETNFPDEDSVVVQNILFKVNPDLAGAYMVDDNVFCIANSAFANSTKLSKIIIPENVKGISDNSFEKCKQKLIVYFLSKDCVILHSAKLPNSTVFYCYDGSTAYNFADKKGIDCEIICEHENFELRNTITATCTQYGYTGDKFCLNCVMYFEIGKVIEPTHSFEDTIVPPTCLSSGYTYQKCSLCDYTVMKDSVDIANHTEVTLSKVEPTCTSTGLTEGKKCSVCGLILTPQEVIEKANHTEETIDGVEATCGNYGLTDGKICSVCGKLLKKQELVSPTGNHSFGSWSNSVEPTCISNGQKERTCSVCSKKETQVLETSEHKFEEKEIEATCCQNGVQYLECSVCSLCKTIEITDKKSHSMKLTKEISPNCVSDGVKVNTCENCGYVSIEITEKLNHKPEKILVSNSPKIEKNICTICGEDVDAQTKVDENGHRWAVDYGEEATCQKAGLTEGAHCSICKEVVVEQTKIEKLDHTKSAWIEDRKPSCKTTGSAHIECTVCHEKLQTKVLQKTDHQYKITVINPTCTVDGYTSHTCSVCLYSYQDNKVNATGHKDVDLNNICDFCGDVLGETSCSCMCHSSGIKQVIWKILQVFYKIFGMKQQCDCGISHY